MVGSFLGPALPLMLACQPTVGVTDAGVPRPSGAEPVVVNESTAIHTMRFWIKEFQSKQDQYFEETGHSAEDVTVGGRIAPLGSTYTTVYWGEPVAAGYEVTVTYDEPTGRACQLAEGRHAHPDDAGKILCNV